MRLLTALFALAGLAFATPVLAQSERRKDSVEYPQGHSDWKATDQAAKENFWRFISCIADRDAEDADRIIFLEGNPREVWIEVRKLTRENGRCVDGGTLELRFPPYFLQGMLAGIRIADRYEDLSAPDYASVPVPDFKAIYPEKGSDEAKTMFLMNVFADCVARAQPQTVLDLLKSPYRKPEAMPFWKALGDTMSYCLPAEDGQEIALDPFSMRIYFGLAVLRLEKDMMKNASPAAKAAE